MYGCFATFYLYSYPSGRLANTSIVSTFLFVKNRHKNVKSVMIKKQTLGGLTFIFNLIFK